MASLLGIAIFGIFMASTFNGSLDAQLADIAPTAETQQVIDAQRENLAGAQIAVADESTRQQIEQAFDRAYVSGFRVVMFIAAGWPSSARRRRGL